MNPWASLHIKTLHKVSRKLWHLTIIISRVLDQSCRLQVYLLHVLHLFLWNLTLLSTGGPSILWKPRMATLISTFALGFQSWLFDLGGRYIVLGMMIKAFITAPSISARDVSLDAKIDSIFIIKSTRHQFNSLDDLIQSWDHRYNFKDLMSKFQSPIVYISHRRYIHWWRSIFQQVIIDGEPVTGIHVTPGLLIRRTGMEYVLLTVFMFGVHH